MSLNFTDIRAKHDLTEVARQYTQLGRSRNGPCPLCGGRDRFFIHRNRTHWGCRHCGKFGGDVIDLVAKIHKVSVADAARILEGQPPHHEEQQYSYAKWESDDWQHRCWIELESTSALLTRQTPRAYLRSRLLNIEWCQRYRLGYSPDRFRPQTQSKEPAVVIPHLFADGKCTAVKYRFLDANATGNCRFVQLKGSEPTLFGSHLMQGAPSLIAIEGEFNCIAVRQSTDPGEFDVISFGSDSTPKYLPIATKRYGSVIIWQDDSAKLEATLRLINHPNAKGRFSPNGKDACDLLQYGNDAILETIHGGTP